MPPQNFAINMIKNAALDAGATGVLIFRDTAVPAVIFDVSGGLSERARIDLYGKMLIVAVFPETDGGPSGIES
jgi:hypothetical protein